MTRITRRTVIKGTAALAASTALGGTFGSRAMAADMAFKPEEGAQIRIVRFNSFLKPEDEAFMAIVQSFTDATGVPVQVDSESMQDIGAKATVAATVGAGPDIMWGKGVMGLLFPHAALDVSDVAEHIGSVHGGWVGNAVPYGKGDRDFWVQIPFGYVGGLVNYRQSAIEEAGFQSVPEDLEGFAALVEAMNGIGKPAGFAVSRNATGDANDFLHWALFAHGGQTVDGDDKPAIDSPETVAALDYVKALHGNFAAGTESWNDGSNNAAFTGEQIYMTHNAASIYGSLKRDGNPMADDTFHAHYPLSVEGKATEMSPAWPMVAFKHTKYPNAVKAFLAHLMAPDSYAQFLNNAQAYFSPTVNGQNELEVWKDPKYAPFRDFAEAALPFSHGGSINAAAALAHADNVVPDMFAQVVTGQKTSAEAATDAQARLERFYRL